MSNFTDPSKEDTTAAPAADAPLNDVATDAAGENAPAGEAPTSELPLVTDVAGSMEAAPSDVATGADAGTEATPANAEANAGPELSVTEPVPLGDTASSVSAPEADASQGDSAAPQADASLPSSGAEPAHDAALGESTPGVYQQPTNDPAVNPELRDTDVGGAAPSEKPADAAPVLEHPTPAEAPHPTDPQTGKPLSDDRLEDLGLKDAVKDAGAEAGVSAGGDKCSAAPAAPAKLDTAGDLGQDGNDLMSDSEFTKIKQLIKRVEQRLLDVLAKLGE